jgi:hypothetical protein
METNMRLQPLMPVLFAVLLLLPFCPVGMAASSVESSASAAQVHEEVSEALQAIGSYTAEQRDAALAKAGETLKKTDARIDQLQHRIDRNWETMNDTAREKARAALKTLQQQRTGLAEWYGGLKHSSANAWEELKRGFTKSYRELENSLEKARQEY